MLINGNATQETVKNQLKTENLWVKHFKKHRCHLALWSLFGSCRNCWMMAALGRAKKTN
jgi:hypothetical protein